MVKGEQDAMANYTENYNLVKPTMAETADIRTINGNMDAVDNIMHGSQTSIAEAFDPNKAGGYAIRETVMYQYELYECIHPHTGAWNAENWVRTTASDVGGNYVDITPTYNTGLKVADTNIDGDLDEIDVPYMTGATSGADGAGGLVPAPTSADVGKYLGADGRWSTPAGGGGISGEAVTYDILYQAQSNSGAPVNTVITYNNNKNLSDYDLCYVYVTVSASEDATLFESHSFSPKQQPKPVFRVTGYGSRFANIEMTDTDFTVTAETGESWEYTYKVYTILGIKITAKANSVETTLWSGSETPTGSDTYTANLSDSIENYDIIAIEGTDDNGYMTTSLYPVSYLTTGEDYIDANTSQCGVFFRLASSTSIVIGVYATAHPTTYTAIKGIRYGGTAVEANPVGQPTATLNTVAINGTVYDIAGTGGAGGATKIDTLYSDASGAPHLTAIPLPHNINDYDVIYMKVSNPTDISNFNIYCYASFMPQMLNTGEKVSVQALYGQRVMDVYFDDGDTFEIVRTDGDFRNTTIYEMVGVKIGADGGRPLIDEVLYTDTTGTTGTQNITLSDRLDNYDAIYFEFYFPSEATYETANPSPLQRIVEAPTGASYKYFVQTYPSYGNRYITMGSADGGTSAVLVASAWNDINPSVYRIHGVKFTGGRDYHVYDSDEKIVGEWFGQTLYEKTIVLKENGTLKYSYSNNEFIDCLPHNIEYMDIVKLYSTRENTGYIDVGMTGGEVVTVPNPSTHNIYFTSQHNPADVIVTIQYTKATS